MNGVVEGTGSLFQAGVWIVGMAQSELFVSFYLVVKFDAELPTIDVPGKDFKFTD